MGPKGGGGEGAAAGRGPAGSGKSRGRRTAAAPSSGSYLKMNLRHKNKMRHCKTKRFGDSSRSIGKRFRNGKLILAKHEWFAQRRANAQVGLYADLLTPEQLAQDLQRAAALRPAADAQEEETKAGSAVTQQRRPLQAGVSADEDLVQGINRAFEHLDEYDRAARKEMAELGLADLDDAQMTALLERGTDAGGLFAPLLPLRAAGSSSSSSASSAAAASSISRGDDADIEVVDVDASAPKPAHRDPVYLQRLAESSLGRQSILRSFFNFTSFNRGQEEAIEMVLEGKSTLLILPTAGGKSLCYQLPAAVLPGLTLVITPLISLMQDQLAHLPRTLPGAFWNSALPYEAVRDIKDRLRSGAIKVLFVSPEKALSPGFQETLRTLLPHGVSLACVDEAHCVSEWSHCFRPTYLRLARVLHQVLRVKAILALTATATRQTQTALCRALHIPEQHVRRTAVLRRNLVLTASRDHDRRQALMALVCSSLHKGFKPAIVYVSTQAETVEVAGFLGENRELKCAAYHAGFTTDQRAATQNRFMKGDLDVLVATVAFGMGLDKQDVRAVIHYSMPRTLEHYVQEVGRAGRDDKPALCHAFYDVADVAKMRSLANSDGVDRVSVRGLAARIFGTLEETPAGDFIAISLSEMREALDMSEAVLSTVLTQMELVSASELEARRERLVAGLRKRGIQHADVGRDEWQPHLMDATLFSSCDPFARIADTGHNKAVIGFIKTSPSVLAQRNFILQLLFAQHGVPLSSWEHSPLKQQQQQGDNSMAASSSSSSSSSSSLFPENPLGKHNLKSKTGRYSLDICQAVSVARGLGLAMHLADVQRGLRELMGAGEVALSWESECVFVQVLQQPGECFDSLVDVVFGRMDLQQQSSIRKVGLRSSLPRLCLSVIRFLAVCLLGFFSLDLNPRPT